VFSVAFSSNYHSSLCWLVVVDCVFGVFSFPA